MKINIKNLYLKSSKSQNIIARGMILTFFILTFFSCTEVVREPESPFNHNIQTDKKPWSHEQFQNDPDYFTFAIISDLTGGERPEIFQVAVEQLSLLRPEFIMSVGDLIEGGTEDRDQLHKEWESFDSRASKTSSPIFHVGGNHDLTNLVMRDVWEERYGVRYYHFVYSNVLFLILDSEDYADERLMEIYKARAEAIEILDGETPEKYPETEYYSMPERSTGGISDTQNKYFEEVIAKNPNVRWTFLFMHKPVWKDEESGGLTRIEAALADRPYTVFNGHEHNYQYTQKNNRNYIMLGTTGGIQSPSSKGAFDHVCLITMTDKGPSMANLKLEGILDLTGNIPLNGDTLCFEAGKCIN